jgi:hypothetical protein
LPETKRELKQSEDYDGIIMGGQSDKAFSFKQELGIFLPCLDRVVANAY